MLSREQLRAELGSEAKNSSERIVDVHVAAMRKKLGSARQSIKTVHGKGYRFVL
ncbi:MAG: winged helix-turn-helix domain-containing protein [Planctomycetota bacterium]